MTPTDEQLEIIEAVRNSRDNIIVNAYAGAAKTSTLVMVAEAVSVPMLCLAFNSSIAKEMQERLPENCIAQTMNALGHRAWANQLNKKLRVDARKRGDMVKAKIEAEPKAKQEKLWAGFRDMIKATEHLAQIGYCPKGISGAKPLVAESEIAFDTDFSDDELRIIFDVAREAIRAAQGGHIDFNEQILMPVLFRLKFPAYPIVMVDEAQDLSPINHALLELVATNRLLAVGDECQAIYGFRGADTNSMKRLQERFSMREKRLTISFRCPHAVVEHCRWHAPDMKAPVWASEGSVRRLDTWSLSDIPDGAAIICRNNAPLMSLALRMLRHGRRPQLKGNDLAARLVRDMKGLSGKRFDRNMSQQAALAALDQWRAAMTKRYKGAEFVRDKYECMRIFLEDQETLGRAVDHAAHVLEQHGPVHLMTAHKAKGLEYEDVFILNVHLMADEGQDLNVRYVAATRAQRNLTYIQTGGLTTEET